MNTDQNSANRMTALVAIIRAARISGDRDLERSAKRELSLRFGIKLTFAEDSHSTRREVSRHA